MKKTDDAIARAKAILEKRREELQKEYDEAEGNYHDTGYDKYYKMMIDREEDMERLDKIIDAKLRIARAERNNNKANLAKALFLDRLEKLADEYPGDEYVRQICDRCRGLWEFAEVEANNARGI